MTDWTAKSPPPLNCDADALFDGIHWHQKWEVFVGIFTPGRNPVAELCDAIQLPQDLRGLRILDVGAWHGCFSFECERRGAKEVIAMSPESPDIVGFNRLKKALKSEVNYRMGSVYSLDPHELGMFDLILFLGVLYHLRYPLLAIDNLRRVAQGPVLIETHLIDEHFVLPGEPPNQAVTLNSLNPLLTNVPIWQFYQINELAGDASNWFGPNSAAVTAAFASGGFNVELLKKWATRGTFRASPIAGPAEYITLRCYESQFSAVKKSLNLDNSAGDN